MNSFALSSIINLYPIDSILLYNPFSSISIIFVIASRESWSNVIISSTRLINSGANDLFKAFWITLRENSLSSRRLCVANQTPRPNDDNSVFKVYHPAITVSQTSFIHYLKQDIEYIRMRFFYFIKQYNRIWFAAYFFC